MNINSKQLPIKAHYFFFMAAMGPILPFLPVYGKQLGVSPVIMGSVTAILPVLFLIAKLSFGVLADHYYSWRKCIFMSLLAFTTINYATMYFLPESSGPILPEHGFSKLTCPQLDLCSSTNVTTSCDNGKHTKCYWTCDDGTNFNESTFFYARRAHLSTSSSCIVHNYSNVTCRENSSCYVNCDSFIETCGFYSSATFWGFVFLISVGTICFNVANSISDAVCFDVLGEGGQMGYGRQRVWGTIGFGIAALLAGYFIDLWSEGKVIKTYTPAFLLMLIFSALDLLCCLKLELPSMSGAQNVIKDVYQLIRLKPIAIFMCFTVIIGIMDSFIVYFLLWHMEDLAMKTGFMYQIKLIEGLTIAAESLGGEVIFFSLAGKILKLIGYGYTLTFCFVCYAFRFGFISLAPTPWWIVLVELFMQGPTYALSYTTIVSYASAVSPPGTSAAVQGIVSGLDDGLGFAIGSLIGGIIYNKYGGVVTFQIFTAVAIVSAVVYFGCYMFFLRHEMPKAGRSQNVVYKSPEKAHSECVTENA